MVDKKKIIALLITMSVVLTWLINITYLGKSKGGSLLVVPHLSDIDLDKYDFTKNGKQPKRSIPLVFVDEHHEVVPYWSREIVNGNLNKKGNILVHVDGHSDLNVPSNLEKILKTNISTNLDNLSPFMEGNDKFITPFLLNGMYEGFLWVYPKFSEPVNTTFYNQVKAFGFTQDRMPCLCNALKKSSKTTCVRVFGIQLEENKVAENTIPAEECNLSKPFRLQFINEEYLEQFLASGWLEDVNQIVLDIDEDFYGVATDYARALNYFSNSDLQKISDILDNIFCSVSVDDERYLDRILREVLSDLISFKESHKSFTESDVYKTARDFVIDKMQEPRLKCRNRDRTGKKAIYLARLLHTFTTDQIMMLRRLHFCLSHTPLLGRSKFGVCLGMPINDQTTHASYPTTTIINHKSKIISKLFRKLFKGYPGPQIVTVCRSIRDSYTSRPKFRQIENSLLLALKEAAFEESVSLVEEYDKHLLFGKEGWIDV